MLPTIYNITDNSYIINIYVHTRLCLMCNIRSGNQIKSLGIINNNIKYNKILFVTCLNYFIEFV